VAGFGADDVCVDGRRGAAVTALAAWAGCLAVLAVLSVLDGRPRSILVVPLAVAFFSGLAVLIGSVCGVIFGERPEEWTRAGMLLVAVCAATTGAGLMALANWSDSDAIRYGVGLLGAAGVWVCIGAVMGAIFGRLPETGMAEGD
jgi:hypothetical protein